MAILFKTIPLKYEIVAFFSNFLILTFPILSHAAFLCILVLLLLHISFRN